MFTFVMFIRTDMVKVGDKVRFLNSTGGGLVKELRGKQMVIVEDESGFDFPILIAECVVVGTNDSGLQTTQSKREELEIIQPKQQKSEEDRKILNSQFSILNSIKETPEGERLSAYIAFLPVDPKAMMQTAYEAWFINDSNYFMYFTYQNRHNNSWRCRFHGLIEPNTKVYLEEFGKDELNVLEHIGFQIIAFKQDKPFGLKNALSVELRLDMVKFYKTHCFTENDYFDENALIFKIIRHDVPERQLLVTATDIQEAMLQKKQDLRHDPLPVKKPSKLERPTIEIDLHINQLLDTTEGMGAGDILNYQMNKFHEILKLYAGEKGRKIVFIHGKGEGILRTAIEKELKTKYKSYIFQDASFQEYGFGATLVKIR
ncbi:MAG: DUF2027 domain-containing protein [Tannerella sp.]|jgi:hypothetical protein|nr:DUF2027 domain-containing protein [Tannerella sp.]